MFKHTLYTRNSGRIWLFLSVSLTMLFSLLIPTPARADLPPGIQEYYVLGFEYHHFRMIQNVESLENVTAENQYMASIVDVTATADNQIIFYDHWEDSYEVDIFNPSTTGFVTSTLIFGDGNPDNGDAANYVVGYDIGERGVDKIWAGDSLPLNSRYDLDSTSAITGFVPLNPRENSYFRFDSGDRIVSAGGPIGLVHAMWPVEKVGASFIEHTWAGDSWEIYSAQALKDALKYATPIGRDLAGLQFEHVDLQVQALLDNTTITVDNGNGGSVTFQLDRGQTYFSGDDGDGDFGGAYINDTRDDSLNIAVLAGTTIVADKQIQAGLVAYNTGPQDRYYNMIPQNLWDKYYIMPTSDNPISADIGHSEVYIYNPNTFTLTVSSVDTAGWNTAFDIAPTSVLSYQLATGASTLGEAVPTLSGVSLSSDNHFWAIHTADANSGHFDWGNTFLPLFFLSDEYYTSWAPGNVLLPPSGQYICNRFGNTFVGGPPFNRLCPNGSPLWVTAVEDNTRLHVDYNNDDVIDESLLLNSLEVVMLRDDNDFDQSGIHIWTEAGQKIAAIWGADAVGGGSSTPNMDVGHLMLPINHNWMDSVYLFEKDANPEVFSAEGGSTTFSLRATASIFADVNDLIFTDTLSTGWTYVSGSTVISYPDGTIGTFEPAPSVITSTVAGGQVATQTVLSWDLGTSLAPRETVELQFQATISNPKNTIGAYHFDGFESNNYQGGVGPWLDDWIESENNGPATGDIQIVDNSTVDPYSGNRQLRIVNNNQSITRTIDLSDFTQPILRFKRYFRELEQSNEHFGIDVSVDNGDSYTTALDWIDSPSNPVKQDVWVQEEADLSPYIADSTIIRFRGIDNLASTDYFYIDDVEIYEGFAVHTDLATARGQYMGFDYFAQARKNIYISPFTLFMEVSTEAIELGSTVIFSFTYANTSDTITDTEFVIQDTLPPGFNFVGASSNGVYITQTNTVSWTIGDILGSTQGTVVLTTTMVNTSRPDNGDPSENTGNLFNDRYFIRSNIIHMTILAPDLSVVKGAPGSIHPGDPITYTISYENYGAIAATNTIISDVVPANTTYQPGSCTGCTYYTDTQTLIWALGDLAPGASDELSFIVHTPDYLFGSNVQNVASVNHDFIATPDLAIANTKVDVIALDKRVNLSLVGPGQILSFTLDYHAITNTAGFLYDTIPDHTDYIDGSAIGESGIITPAYSVDGIHYQANTPDPASSVTHLRWEIQLISGTTKSTGFQVQVDDNLDNEATIKNQASLSIPGVDEFFSNRISIRTVKLLLNKTGPHVADQGTTFTYTLRFRNNGSRAATVTLSDTLPVSATYVSASPTPISTNPVIWPPITVPADNNDIEYTVVVSITDDVPLGTELRNEAQLGSDQHTVEDFSLTYVAQPISIVPNNESSAHQLDIVCYSHRVFNNDLAPDTANLTASYSDWFNPTLALYKDVNGNGEYDSSTDTPLSDTNGDLIIDTGVINGNNSFTRILACLTIPDNVEDGTSHVATIRATSVTTPTNFSEATDTTHILYKNALSIIKRESEPLLSGDQVAYTIVVKNLYFVVPVTHTNLVITDTAIPNLTFIGGNITPGGNIIVTASAMTATYPSLALNEAITITMQAALAPALDHGTIITNVAYVASDQQDPPARTSLYGTISPDLVIQKFATDATGPPTVVGDTISYTIRVTNTNPTYTHNDVTIYDTLPVSVTFVNGSETIAPAGTVAYFPGPHAISATVSSLAPQAVAEVSFAVTLNPDTIGHYIANTAVIDSDEQSPAPPADPTNTVVVPPTVGFESLTYSMNEDDGSATITVTLNAIPGLIATVEYTTSDGTAIEGEDYPAASGTLTFVPGDTSETFTVNVFPDTKDEPDETIILTLSNADNADIGDDNQAELTILNDDDPPSVSFSSDSYSLTEEDGPATITVTLGQESGQIVTVVYDTNDGTAIAGEDYSSAGGTLVFDPGDTIQTFDVTITADTKDEIDETVNLMLHSPGNAILTDPSAATLTIQDNDEPPDVYFDTTAYTVTEDTGPASITVTLSAESGKSVTVTYTASDGTATTSEDYNAVSDTLTFDPGDTAQTFDVSIIADLKDESDETVNLALNIAGNSNITNPSTATLTIVDDDEPPDVYFRTSDYDATEASGLATIDVLLSAESGNIVTVTYSSSDGTATTDTDYSAVSGTLTFTLGSTSQTFDVPITDDTKDEADETVNLALTDAGNSNIASPSTATLTISDDDAALVNISDVTEAEGNSGTTNATFTVTLSNESVFTVTVDYATTSDTATAGEDYTAANGALTFTPGITTQLLTVQVLGDTLDENDETFTVDLDNLVNASFGDNQGLVTIIDDDDSPNVSFSAADYDKDESNTSTPITVTLGAESGKAITVTYATADGTATAGEDYSAVSDTLTFDPGDTVQTFDVPINDDVIDEYDESIWLQLSNPVNATLTGTNPATLTIIDNDETTAQLAIGNASVTEGDTITTNAVFTVTVSPISGKAITVTYDTTDGTASAADGDYTAIVTGILVIPAEADNTQVTIPVHGDYIDEADETFSVTLSNPQNATIADGQGSGSGNIVDDDSAGITIVESDGSTDITEDGVIDTYSLVLDSEPTADVTITVDPDEQSDVGAGSGAAILLTFDSNNWDTAQTVAIAAVDDDLPEGPHVSIISHSAASSDPIYDDFAPIADVIANVSDDDAPGVVVIPTVVAVTEGGITDTYTIRLTAQPTTTVIISITTDGQTSVTPDLLTFNAGTWSAPQQVIVTAVDDPMIEEPHFSTITHTAASADPGYDNITILNVTANVSDNDSAGVAVLPTVIAVTESGITDTYTIQLTAPPTATVLISITTDEQTFVSPTLLAFDTVTWDMPQQVIVTAVDDTVIEGAHFSTITHTITSADPVFDDITVPSIIVNVIDNDAPGVAVIPTAIAVTEGGTTDMYTVRLNTQPTDVVTISIATDGQTTVTPTLLTFDTVNWETAQQIIVTAVDDDVEEGPHTSSISHTAVSADTDYDGFSPIDNVTVDITDNDAGGEELFVQFDDVAYSTRETAGAAVIIVTLNTTPTVPVTVTYGASGGTATDGSDYTSVNDTLRFEVGQSSQTFTIPILSDVLREGDETVILTLSDPINADLGTPITATLTIVDNVLFVPLVTYRYNNN